MVGDAAVEACTVRAERGGDDLWEATVIGCNGSRGGRKSGRRGGRRWKVENGGLNLDPSSSGSGKEKISDYLGTSGVLLCQIL
ncbi:hypothetical protein Scep_012346 [Stephania cephalantha]|uniref:Uncharacterized protein n=1 Tax=Stephania cephalantha TaxID=152367 RepID=A0AAP0P6M5_9MAGN